MVCLFLPYFFCNWLKVQFHFCSHNICIQYEHKTPLQIQNPPCMISTETRYTIYEIMLFQNASVCKEQLSMDFRRI